MTREELAKATQEFLNKGGSVQKIPPEVTGEKSEGEIELISDEESEHRAEMRSQQAYEYSLARVFEGVTD